MIQHKDVKEKSNSLDIFLQIWTVQFDSKTEIELFKSKRLLNFQKRRFFTVLFHSRSLNAQPLRLKAS